MTTVSIVVPAYKEPGLRQFHSRLKEALDFWWSWDVVYSVGDDETYRLACRIVLEHNLTNYGRSRSVRVRMQPGRGLGEGVRIGYEAALASRAEYIVTMEADGSNDPADICRLVSEVEPICGIPFNGSAVASKRLDSRPRWKRALSSCYRAMLRARYGLGFDGEGVGDYTHLFRCAPRQVVQKVLPMLKYSGYEGVAEFHVRAKQAGCPFILSPLTDYRKRVVGESKLTARKMLSMGKLLFR